MKEVDEFQDAVAAYTRAMLIERISGSLGDIKVARKAGEVMQEKKVILLDKISSLESVLTEQAEMELYS